MNILGACETMCSVEECLRREREFQVSEFEATEDTKDKPPRLRKIDSNK